MESHPIHTIVTHGPHTGINHIDEIGGIVLARHFGRQLWPGIENAEIVVHNPKIHEDGRSEAEWERDGYWFIGEGGSDEKPFRFNDHPATKHPNDCAFTKVAKHLDLDDDPAWRWLGKEILHEDRNATRRADHDHLARIIKKASRFHPSSTVEGLAHMCLFALHKCYHTTGGVFEEYRLGLGLRRPVIETALRYCHPNDEDMVNGIIGVIDEAEEKADESFWKAVQFLQEGLTRDDGTVMVYDIPNPNFGRKVRMVYIVGENYDLPAVSRWPDAWPDGQVADLVIKREPLAPELDRLFIASRRGARFESLDPLVVKLRRLEQAYDLDLTPVHSSFELGKDGALNRVFNFQGGQALMSGAPTHPYEERMTRLGDPSFSDELVSVSAEFLAKCPRLPKKLWEQRERQRGRL